MITQEAHPYRPFVKRAIELEIDARERAGDPTFPPAAVRFITVASRLEAVLSEPDVAMRRELLILAAADLQLWLEHELA